LSEERKKANANASRTTLLLIDEPELYLHPQAIEQIRSSLRQLAGAGYQVVFTTHSPNMIPRSDAPNALIIRRNSQTGTHTLPRLKEAVETAIGEGLAQSEILFSLSNASKILFCDTVVLAEGSTEKIVFPDLFYAATGKTLDGARIGLVALGGSGDIANAIKVLTAMSIPTKAVVDLDYAFKVAPKVMLIDPQHPAVVSCKSTFGQLQQLGQISLDNEGLPTKHHDGSAASAAYEFLAAHNDGVAPVEQVHQHLKGQNIWLWRRGAIEAHIGTANKSKQAHMAFIAAVALPNAVQGLPDPQGIQELCTWLQS
jgi:putative ATP-dependent endonuclease of OLD family